MSNDKLTEWVNTQLSSGGRIVLLETFAHHVVVALVCSEELFLSFKKDLSATDSIIGVGFILSSADNESEYTKGPENAFEKLPKANYFKFPLGSYRGLAKIYLRGIKQTTKIFNVII